MLSLFFVRHIHADVQNVISSQEDASVVGGQSVINPLGSLLKQHVHVTITANHSASVFNSVFQDNGYVAVQLFC